ncbi:MAG: haloacid dehalogenase-like hydrolase [Candidatus Thalassarchaeaceae archaeon]|nr:haloacid dehalogenase-like hydrolase [Candidatus Thalassarchaeaceae archaeon]
MNVSSPGLPLAVDMDGTLILTDMSWVSFRKVIIRRPWMLLGMLLKEFSGRRAEWKRDLAERLDFTPSDLEYHPGFLDWLTGEHAKGRELILATASDRIVAERVAGHVGLFSDVLASDMSFNLRGEKKAEALVSRYGERGFAYAGNSKHDIDVWKHSGEVIVVNPERGLLTRIGDEADIIFE